MAGDPQEDFCVLRLHLLGGQVILQRLGRVEFLVIDVTFFGEFTGTFPETRTHGKDEEKSEKESSGEGRGFYKHENK